MLIDYLRYLAEYSLPKNDADCIIFPHIDGDFRFLVTYTPHLDNEANYTIPAIRNRWDLLKERLEK